MEYSIHIFRYVLSFNLEIRLQQFFETFGGWHDLKSFVQKLLFVLRS